MNYDQNWSGGRAKDGGGKDIAILLILLIFVLFGLASYVMFQKVADLGEQTRMLTERIAELEARLDKNPSPAYSSKWAPGEKDETLENQQGPELSSQGNSPSEQPAIEPRPVETLKVRPDGTFIEPQAGPGSGGHDKAASNETSRGALAPAAKSRQPDDPTSDTPARSLQPGTTEVTLDRCQRNGAEVVCDLEISSSSRHTKKIMISNRETLATDNTNATFRISSFQIGEMGDHQRYRSEAFVSRRLPVPVRFTFHNLPSDIDRLQSAQFNIDDKLFVFEQLKIDPGTTSLLARKRLLAKGAKEKSGTSDTASTSAFRNYRRVGDISVNLQYCVKGKRYFYCDLKLLNMGPFRTKVTVSKDKTFARTHANTVSRFTSVSAGSSGQQHHHQTAVFLRKGAPVSVRYFLFNPPAGVVDYKSMQFNIDGQKVTFENVALSS